MAQPTMRLVRDGAIDEPASAALRDARPAAPHGHFRFGPERETHEEIWTGDAHAAMTKIMTELPTHWRFFVKTRLFAMLRTPAPDGAAAVRAAFAELRTTYPGLDA